MVEDVLPFCSLFSAHIRPDLTSIGRLRYIFSTFQRIFNQSVFLTRCHIATATGNPFSCRPDASSVHRPGVRGRAPGPSVCRHPAETPPLVGLTPAPSTDLAFEDVPRGPPCVVTLRKPLPLSA